MEDETLMCLQTAEMEQVDCKTPFVGAFDKSFYSMLVLRNVKTVVVEAIYVNFIQRLLWLFFMKEGSLHKLEVCFLTACKMISLAV